MRLKIKLFSVYKEAFGLHEITVELHANEITVENLINTLATISAKFNKIVKEFPPAILVNGLPLQKSDKIYGDCEVVLFPPASGGFLVKSFSSLRGTSNSKIS
uniref:MoaD/ThiS family protein n=1 Tax=Ignisphaera aggregans TaxID=334771 RepID=A0A7J2T9H3_9CREN